MTMRLVVLSALALAAVVGCGVPDGPAIAQNNASVPKTTPTPPPLKKDDKTKPTEPPVKPVEQDPAKLGEKITDTVVGSGAVAEPGDTLSMLYTGRLTNGTVFDSTAKHDNKPFTFPLGAGQVIKGWDLGVKGMKVGGKRTLVIPPELGYGAEAKDTIPANSTLIFDIELKDVQKVADATTVVRTVVKPGSGPAVKKGDVVSITYKAMLIDGTVVDDETAKPVQFKVGAPEVQVPGLNLALEGMKKGEVVEAKIPPALGPLPGPNSAKVPPGSTLKFEITLVKIG